MNNPVPNRGQQPAPRRQFFDVVRPGGVPAAPTARPVIARPQVQDQNIAMSGVGEPVKVAQARQNPLPPSPPPPPPPPPPAQPAIPVSPASATRSSPRPNPPMQSAAAIPVRPPSSQQGVVQSPMPAPMQPVIDSSTFFAPDPQPVGARSKHGILSEVLAVLAIVLLLAVIVNILLDAEVINLPLPHTNFFDY